MMYLCLVQGCWQFWQIKHPKCISDHTWFSTIHQIHIVDGEKFIRTPWTELQKVETFLNLTSVLTQDNFFFNGTKGFYCSRDIRSHGSWTCTRDKCLGRSKGRPKPPVKEETFQRLTEFFAPHNKMFYDMVGQVFEWPAYDWKSNLETYVVL